MCFVSSLHVLLAHVLINVVMVSFTGLIHNFALVMILDGYTRCLFFCLLTHLKVYSFLHYYI